jgi:hypothetical protein
VEHTALPPPPTPATRVSKFKSMRNESPAIVDAKTGQQRSPLAADLIEREPIASAKAPDADDSDTDDPVIERQRIASEYHARRNRLIQQQGGFSTTDNDHDHQAQAKRGDGIVRVPLDDDEPAAGTGQKRSRFMTARLSGRT